VLTVFDSIKNMLADLAKNRSGQTGRLGPSNIAHPHPHMSILKHCADLLWVESKPSWHHVAMRSSQCQGSRARFRCCSFSPSWSNFLLMLNFLDSTQAGGKLSWSGQWVVVFTKTHFTQHAAYSTGRRTCCCKNARTLHEACTTASGSLAPRKFLRIASILPDKAFISTTQVPMYLAPKKHVFQNQQAYNYRGQNIRRACYPYLSFHYRSPLFDNLHNNPT